MKTVNITLTAGTIRSAIGLGGGQGWTRTGKSTIRVSNVKLGGILATDSNGHADDIDAEFKNCTFSDGYKSIASINRGMIDKATFVFEGCTFANDIKAYIGAGSGWANSDTNGTPTPEVTESISYEFKNCTGVPTVKIGEGLTNANVTVTGAPVQIEKFYRGSKLADADQSLIAFKIAEGKTWTFNNGLTFATEEDKKATLTTNGKLVVPAVYVPALVSNANDGITISLPDKNMEKVVEDMNTATTKSDLQTKKFSIECQDGVIASNKSVAAELAAAGKVVKVLSYTADATDGKNYSLSTEAVKEAAKITNLPDELAYGTQPITLAFNRTDKTFTATITNGDEFASIDGNVLTIKKPGEVTITLSSGSGEEDETYTQKLKVTKRIVTLTRGLEVDYDTSEETTPPTSKVYDGTTAVTVKLSENGLTFAGKLGNDATGLSLDTYQSGTMADANVGEGKLVTIANAKLVQGSDGKDSTAFYELAPITIVKATVTPKDATVTADDASRDYGKANPTFRATASGLVDGESMANLDGVLRFICGVSQSALADTYTDSIIPYGLTSPNYNITFRPGTLTINAADPEIEIVEAKTIINGANRDIQLKAKLVHKGGSSVEPSAVKFLYTYNGDQQGSVDARKGDDGLYAATIVNAQEAYSINASVTVGEKSSTSAPVSVTIDALIPQSLTWAPSVLPTLVYGQTMTLGATSDEAAATGAFRFDVDNSGNAEIVDGVLKPLKVGKVTIWAVREPDENYSYGMLAKTIEITPKPITVSVTGLDKVYDGTTAIADGTTAIATPTFTLSGIVGDDEVSVNTTDLTLSYASKNAGDNVAVILPELTLTGDDAANYTLVQPKNVTGKITKARLTIKVKDVIRPWNQRHTKYEFETTGLVNNETLAQAYSGTLAVAEEDGVLKLTVEANKSQNYDVTAENGTLTITKGMPKAVVYGSENLGWNSMIVDYQGYDSNDLTLDNTNVASGGKALVKLNGTVLTSSINSKPSTSSSSANAASFSLRSASLRASTEPNWNNTTTFDEIIYGDVARTFSKGDFTYTSTNMSVLTVATDASNVTVTPVGVGNATIIAEKAGEVKIWNVTVTPKSLNLNAEMVKTYDGTATATGTVALGTGIVGTDDVALDLSGITFNYDSKNVGEGKTVTPSQPLVLIGTNANNYTLSRSLTGKITQKEITVNGPIAVYYNGQATHTLTTYPATGLVAGDVAPITVTFADAAVGTRNISSIALTSTGDAANYKLATPLPTNGTIQRSTLVATLPTNASSVNDLKNNITLAIRETGEAVTASAVGFVPTITSSGSGDNTVYSVTGGETTNYSVVYNRNQIGYAAAPVIPGGGGGGSSEPETPETPTTPDTPTGVESISEGSQLYTVKGAVVVSPAEPLHVAIYSVTGQTLFNDEVSYLTQVPAKAGIYVVVIQKGNDHITEKVFVK